MHVISANKSQVVKILSCENARQLLVSGIHFKNRLKINLGKENYFAAKTQKASVVAIVMFSSLFIRVN